MELKLKLLDLLNEYNGSVEEFNNLKDIVCEISEHVELKNEPLMKELLYIAAQKMRTFGYNHMNQISLSEIASEKDYGFVFQNSVVDELYTSTTGNQLDYNQMKIIRHFNLSDSKRIFVSAPTSFGKTFLIREIIFQNRERYKNVALIFPTVSLLNENVLEFSKFVRDKQLGYKIINNTHIELKLEESNLFILTPERMINFLTEYPDLKLDFFFMDEIYKIDNFFNTANSGEEVVEDERDGVFRVALYSLAKITNDFYLAGPYINLEELGEGFKRFIGRYSIMPFEIKNELIKKDHIISWRKSIVLNNETIKFEDTSKTNKLKKLLFHLFEKDLGQSIIYAESKNKVTELARETRNLFPKISDRSTKLRDFIEHLIKRYSISINNSQTTSYWSIIEALNRGIGIHHGSFPKYIQNEILERFNDGDLKFIFTTTSITEGVNTKAKNVIFYGKTKGTKALKTFDIKNINGRAGRYYHHFIGRIFYMESEIYKKLSEQDEKLDFITFSDRTLGYVDLDNCDIRDLSKNNADTKEARDNIIREEGIDTEILSKNKLIDKLKQVELIKILKAKNKNELESLVYQCSSIRAFLTNKTIYKLLDYIRQIGLIDEFDVKKFGIISTQYAMPGGFSLLLKYELEKHEIIDHKKVDLAYMKAFSNIRNIVEYKVPKYISVFGHILKYVSELPEININTDSLSLESIIRFYELGVQTEFGVFLAEMGFPITSIKLLEQNMRETMNYSKEAITNTFQHLEEEFKKHLDVYELNLMKKLLFS